MDALRPSYSRIVLALLAVMFMAGRGRAYSVLTHEELIDLAWNDSIRPVLLARFPRATEEQLVEARAYAYGGSAIQDMGYYPFGKRFFSNLTHYVRTGDFILWMFQNARTVDELAFAIGALTHYVGDSIGHSEAINPATAIEFPKLERKFGPKVTYGESPHGHIRTEFAFDIDERIHTSFAPPAYWRFIGFKVPRKFLECAFVNTYGLDVHEIFGRAHPALKSYQKSVRSFIPAFAQAEVVLHRNQFPPHPNDRAYHSFYKRIARTNYEQSWNNAYRGPGIKAHLLAIVVFIIPKVGAASDLAIKVPNAQTQDAYVVSVNHTMDVFREEIRLIGSSADPPITLANLNLDTGDPTMRGNYVLADEAYASLLARLTSRPGRTLPPGVKENIIQFYDLAGDSADLQPEVQRNLRVLKRMQVAAGN